MAFLIKGHVDVRENIGKHVDDGCVVSTTATNFISYLLHEHARGIPDAVTLMDYDANHQMEDLSALQHHNELDPEDGSHLE